MGIIHDAYRHGRNIYSQMGGAEGIRRTVSENVKEQKKKHAADWKKLHGNTPGVKEYLKSDSGRANARHAVGSAVHREVDRLAKKMGRRGGILGIAGNALFSFARTALGDQLKTLKKDQQIFENVARVRRGDPEIVHMTHNELREVADHSRKYGGKDWMAIQSQSNKELERRQIRKNQEWDKGEQARDDLRLARKQRNAPAEKAVRKTIAEGNLEAHREHEKLSNEQKLKHQLELRKVHGHAQAAKVKVEQQIAKAKKDLDASKTKNLKTRQEEIRKTHESKIRVIKQNASGGGVVQNIETGKTRNASKEEIRNAKNGGNRKVRPAKPKKAAR